MLQHDVNQPRLSASQRSSAKTSIRLRASELRTVSLEMEEWSLDIVIT